MESKIHSIVSKFAGKKIVILGDLSLDSYIFGEVPKSNPEMPGAPLIRKTRVEYRLGCAANVASNLSSLKANTILLGVLGKDAYGKEFSEQCRQKKIKLFPYLEEETIIKQRIIEESHKHYVCRIDYGESNLRPITKNCVDFFINKIKSQKPHAIILSDYNKGVFRSNISIELIKWAKERNIPTIVDPKPENADKFNNATILNPNIMEAKKITSLENSSPREIIKRLKEMTNSKYVVLTLGKNGILTYDNSFHEIPTQAREVIDVVGAGDTVTSLLALSIISGATITEAAQIANIAAGIVVEKHGTATTTTEEILERIEKLNSIF